MAKQYNVNIVGDLTNDNGVLSGFSINDYATLPETLENLTINSLEIVFKFKTNSTTSNNAIFWTDKLTDDPDIPWAGIRLCNYNTDGWVFDLEVTDNNTQVAEIYDSTPITPDTYYYIKALYDNVDGYSLSKSEDGENYTLIGTNATTDIPSNLQAIIGRAVDTDPMPLDGSIDLNESYIKVNGVMWWRGAENITKIQLRHDTAANWTSVNPILLDGEVGIETDTRKQKFGDGVTAWNSLPYDVGSTALQSITLSNVTTALGYTPVNKAGDTMSGGLTAPTLATTQIGIGSISLKNITSGNFSDVTFYDNNNIRTGFVRGNNISSTQNSLQLSAVKKDDVVGATLLLSNNNGTASANINTTLTASNLISNGYLTTSGDINLGGSGRMNLKVSGTSKGTTPASNCYQAFLFNDTDSSHTTWQDMRFGAVECQVLNTGENRMIMSVYKNEAGSTAGATMTLATSSSGSWCTFPNTKCVDGQWVHSQSIAGTSTAKGTYNVSLSSYLPNDGYIYEVMINLRVYNSNSSNAGEVSVYSDIFTKTTYSTINIAGQGAAGGNSRQIGNTFILPVGTGRTITYEIESYAVSNLDLILWGYRRVGTNA